MRKSEIITGLDMGSGRISCVFAVRDDENHKMRVLGGASAICKGLRGGMVLDIEQTARAIESVVDAAECKAKAVATEVYLGVRGTHIQAFDVRGKYAISRTDQEITSEDVVNVIESAKAFQVSQGLEILHIIPQKFSLDRLTGIINPIGMHGSLLEVGVYIVMASTSALTNLLKSVSETGLRVIGGPIYTPLAVGELVVTERDKELSCLLVDAGGQITSMAVYADGCVHFSKELPIGGDHVTRDLAHGLGISMVEAQEVKEKYGATLSDMIEADHVINVTGLRAQTKKEIKQRELLHYIQPRVEEIYEMIYEAMQKCAYASLPGGAILVGGASLLKGMPEAAEQLLELEPVRIGFPAREIVQCSEEYMAQPYLGAVALACYPYLKAWQTDLHSNSRGGLAIKDVWHRITDLF